jgi:hypothetical protein
MVIKMIKTNISNVGIGIMHTNNKCHYFTAQY